MKKMKKFLTLTTILIVLSLILSCNKSSTLGSDLFEGEKLNLQFIDTLKINAYTESPDSVLAYTASSLPYDSLLVGCLADPSFGKTEARIFSQFRTNPSVGLPDFANWNVDSAYIELVYSPTRVYGDTLSPFNLGIYRLAEGLPSSTIYSNKTFKSEITPLKKYQFFPQPTTSVQDIVVYKNTAGVVTDRDTTILSPRIRIPLDNSFLQDLIKWDTSRLNNFTSEFKGLELRAEGTTKAMLNFNFGSAGGTGIYIYYRKKDDTARLSYQFPVNIIHYSNFKHGYADAPIKNYINNANKNDSLYLQGMAGTNVKMEFPNLQTLGKVVINKAELAFTIAPDPKTGDFPPIDQFVLRTAQFDAIADLQLDNAFIVASSSGRPAEKMTLAGGYFRTETVNSTTVRKYIFNVTTHLQQMLDGKKGSTIYILPHFKEEKASRVILYGPQSTQFKPKLNVYFTKV